MDLSGGHTYGVLTAVFVFFSLMYVSYTSTTFSDRSILEI